MNEIEIENELFCIRYETRIFSSYINYGKLERWIPDFSDSTTEDSHLKRYHLACKFVQGERVLDVACGSGRGSLLMATLGNASYVLGIDLESDVIRYARHRNKNNKVEFERGDATNLQFENEFDKIVSFETIEHLYSIENYLNGINKALKNNGVFIVSTPISKYNFDDKPKNPYHVQEWGYENFQGILRKKFLIKEIYLQLYPRRDFSFSARVIRKISGLFGRPYISPKMVSTITHINDIEGTIDFSELGKQYKGYQIFFCTKKKKI